MPDEPEDDILHGLIDGHFAAEIVKAISDYARLEYEVDELIWELAEVEPEIGACITAQLFAIAPRMDALISLANARNVQSGHVSKLSKFKVAIGGLANRRHRLAHDPWYSAFISKVIYRLEKTAKAKLIHGYKSVTLEELEKFQSDIRKSSELFRSIRSDILNDFWSLHLPATEGS